MDKQLIVYLGYGIAILNWILPTIASIVVWKYIPKIHSLLVAIKHTLDED